MPFSVKRSISSVTTEALPRLDALEQVAIGNEGDALPPRPVVRREVRLDVVILAEIGFDRRQQLLLGRFRLVERLRREGVLVEQDLAADDLVDPCLVDLQLAQLLGDLDRVAAGAEIGRRALQHRDVRGSLAAIAGISVAAVAPEPMTMTCLSL